jgi:formylglycine-generating enzyme required for sulfatase activity
MRVLIGLLLILGIGGCGPPGTEPAPADSVVNPGQSQNAVPAAEKKGAIETAAIQPQKQMDMEFKELPAGTFTMGSPGTETGRDTRELQHQVTISKPFFMQTTVVTQGQWKAVMGTKPWAGHKQVNSGDDYPAVHINWYQAVQFCEKLSVTEGKTFRLPTEAEWEYACRAGATTAWSFGDSDTKLGDYAWFTNNTHLAGQEYAHEVAKKKPNKVGLFDMHGNVYEWCSDIWRADYYKNSPALDPTGAPSGRARVIRGGTWRFPPKYTRCAYRTYRDADNGFHDNGGFRVVCEEDDHTVVLLKGLATRAGKEQVKVP